MGLLSSLFGSRPKTTKVKTAGLIASTLDHILTNCGVESLLAGSLVMNKDLHVGFHNGIVKKNEMYIATLAIGELEVSESLKMLGGDIYVDALARAAIVRFQSLCPAFAALPNV